MLDNACLCSTLRGYSPAAVSTMKVVRSMLPLLPSSHAALCPALRSSGPDYQEAGKTQAGCRLLSRATGTNRLARGNISVGRRVPRILRADVERGRGGSMEGRVATNRPLRRGEGTSLPAAWGSRGCRVRTL